MGADLYTDFYTAAGFSAKGTLSKKQKGALGPRWQKHQQGTKATLLYVCVFPVQTDKVN